LDQLKGSLSSTGRDYGILHHDCGDRRGIEVAFFYDKDKFEFERDFTHIVLKRSKTRDIYQISLINKHANRDLILVGNHWPSRRGGELISEPYRILAAETLSYWHQRITEEKGKKSR